MKQITSIATNAMSVFSNSNKFEVRCDKEKGGDQEEITFHP
jgi:hypothetical protein